MNISTVLAKRLIFQKPNLLPLATYKLYSTSTQTQDEDKIILPKRIPRGPTDILRALESTVSRDPTAAHYKYHDDPYLIPLSNPQKRIYAMAQESGRKAAHWIRQEHADLFNHREADPMIEAFLPKIVYNDDSDVSEEDLMRSVETVQVSDAHLIYKLLVGKGKAVSEETRQKLLELICYFNDEATLPEELIEERWFRQSSSSKERQKKTWKDGSLAEEIFISIENPSSEAYAAIIQGMAKYYQVERAWQLYEETKTKNLTLPADTYNSLLKIVNFLKESFDLRWSLMLNLLSDMNKCGVKPNLGTLNAVLHSLSTVGSGKLVKESVFKVLREFKDLGIEPSLGSWYNVLITFCKERGPVSTILHDIMKEVENKEHQIQDLSDTYFFVTAMDICRNHLNDVELGKRVNNLLNLGSNYNLIGDSYKESIYYRHYFTLLVNNMPFDEFMSQVYNVLVPNVYVPEPNVMLEVLNQVELNMAVQYVPKLWSDIIIFDHVSRQNVIDKMLDVMIDNQPAKGAELNERFSYIVWDMHSRIENQAEGRIIKVNLTGDLLGKIMMILLRNDDFDKACTIMDKLDKEHSSILGVPKLEALSLFINHCIERKQPSRAIACISYCSDNGFPEVNSFACTLKEKLTLDERHLSQLSKIVGDIDLISKVSVGS